MNNNNDTELFIGSRILTSSGYLKKGTVEYIGPTQFASGEWIGISLDSPDGKNNGSINNIEYFKTKDKYGLFARRSQCKLIFEHNVVSNKDDDFVNNSSSSTNNEPPSLNHSSYFREKLMELHEKAKKLNINSTPPHTLLLCTTNTNTPSISSPSTPNLLLKQTRNLGNYSIDNYNTNIDKIKNIHKQYSILTTTPTNTSNYKSNDSDYNCSSPLDNINMYEKVMNENKFLNEQIRLQNKMIQYNNNQIEELKYELLIIKKTNHTISNSTNNSFSSTTNNMLHNKNDEKQNDNISIEVLKEQILVLETKLNAATWELNLNTDTNNNTQSRCCLFC